jgi:hypothetical protein
VSINATFNDDKRLTSQQIQPAVGDCTLSWLPQEKNNYKTNKPGLQEQWV